MIIERIDISLGGAERSITELSCALQARGLDVTLLAAQGNSDAENVQILCHDRPRKRTPPGVFARTLQHHLYHHHYDIIHSVLPFGFADVYQPRGGSYAEAAMRNAASHENTCLAAFKRKTAFFNHRRQSLMNAERTLCQGPNGPMVVALSQYVVEQFKTHYQLSPERITLVRNGVDVHRRVNRAAADQLNARIRTKLNLQDTDKTTLLLFAAHNFRLKGLGPLLRALANLRRENTQLPCALVIAGNGDFSRYAPMAKHLGLEQNTVFVGAVEDIQNALAIVDVAVLPTFYDPASRFILEALAHNRPVITTRFNGAADLFVDQRHGRIIDCPSHTAALTEALAQMSCRDTLAKMTTAIVEDHMVERVSVDRVAVELIDLYDTLLRKKGQA